MNRVPSGGVDHEPSAGVVERADVEPGRAEAGDGVGEEGAEGHADHSGEM